MVCVIATLRPPAASYAPHNKQPYLVAIGPTQWLTRCAPASSVALAQARGRVARASTRLCAQRNDGPTASASSDDTRPLGPGNTAAGGRPASGSALTSLIVGMVSRGGHLLAWQSAWLLSDRKNPSAFSLRCLRTSGTWPSSCSVSDCLLSTP
jgi:hypothetical protein